MWVLEVAVGIGAGGETISGPPGLGPLVLLPVELVALAEPEVADEAEVLAPDVVVLAVLFGLLLVSQELVL